jgi:superfamily II DNA/RNA helicase
MKVTGELNPGAWVEALPNYIFIEGHKGEVIPEEYFVDLHAGQRRMYDQMDRDFATKAESGEYVLADLKVEARTRLRQISVAEISVRESEKKNGSADAPPIEVYFPANAKSAKYDELLRLLRQHDEQVLISLDFTKAAVRITEWLKRDGISAGLYAGATHTTPTARMRLRESFLAGETRCMVGIPAAMGTGTDGLQTVCRRLYIISEDQNGVTGEQMIGRLDRKGQERPVIITNIHARNTLDLGITTSLAMQAIANAESRALDMANAST